MDIGVAGRTTGFRLPIYIGRLIDSINGSASSAQRAIFLFLLVGTYLVATGFSASDEDLLLSHTLTISQLGASLPVNFSFAIVPGVFVGLHIYALIAYDMLASNLRHFNAQMDATMPSAADRERCRHLLANIEFIQALTAPRRSAADGLFWRWLFRVIIFLPVVVLLIVQINSLRYQSDLITNVQRAWLALDLLALVVFFRRVRLDGQAWPRRLAPRVARWALLLCMPAIVLAANFAYLNVVPAEADPAAVRHDPKSEPWYAPFLTGTIWQQPLDLALCPRLNWGCRYLHVAHRTLIDRVWDNQAMATLRLPGRDGTDALASVEGVVLRGRSLRFAILDESRLYGADLIGADLRHASLRAASVLGAQMANVMLQGADLSTAQLDGAMLAGARMQGATLAGARMPHANLAGAMLQGTDLSNVALQGAVLSNAEMQGADLLEAGLQGADLDAAQLQGASLARAQLQGALLVFAVLQGADLSDAQLQGADLSGAQLQGANLGNAQLQGADLRNVKLWNATGHATVGFADLRGIDARTALLADARAALERALAVIPTQSDRDLVAARVWERSTNPGEPPDLVLTATPAQPALVSDNADAVLTPVGVTTKPDPAFVNLLVGYLLDDLARSNPAIASGLARRAAHALSQDATDVVALALACRLPADAVRSTIVSEPRLNLFYSTKAALGALTHCTP